MLSENGMSSKIQVESQYQPYYLRMENLPWLANHEDIHGFFKNITIPKGGISYHNGGAIVAFSNEEDRNKGLEMNDKCIMGSFIELSALKRSDLRRIRCRNVCRVLRFPKPVDPSERILKRIRPTFKPKDAFDETCSIFNPEETDAVPAFTDSSADRKTKRKIKPTLLKDISNFSSFFHGDEVMKPDQPCAKKIKIDEALLLAPICTT